MCGLMAVARAGGQAAWRAPASWGGEMQGRAGQTAAEQAPPSLPPCRPACHSRVLTHPRGGRAGPPEPACWGRRPPARYPPGSTTAVQREGAGRGGGRCEASGGWPRRRPGQGSCIALATSCGAHPPPAPALQLLQPSIHPSIRALPLPYLHVFIVLLLSWVAPLLPLDHCGHGMGTAWARRGAQSRVAGGHWSRSRDAARAEGGTPCRRRPCGHGRARHSQPALALGAPKQKRKRSALAYP